MKIYHCECGKYWKYKKDEKGKLENVYLTKPKVNSYKNPTIIKKYCNDCGKHRPMLPSKITISTSRKIFGSNDVKDIKPNTFTRDLVEKYGESVIPALKKLLEADAIEVYAGLGETIHGVYIPSNLTLIKCVRSDWRQKLQEKEIWEIHKKRVDRLRQQGRDVNAYSIYKQVESEIKNRKSYRG